MGYSVLRGKKKESLNDNFVCDHECLRDQHFGFLKLLQFIIFIINTYIVIIIYVCIFVL